MSARKLLAGAALLLATLPRCADLAPIAAGVCGNGVIEGPEDCDSTSGKCGQPNTSAACRYVCKTADDCPGGWRCGGDGICRHPTGTLSVGPVLDNDGQLEVDLGDFDGDGHSDLLSTSLGGVMEVEYHGATGFERSAGLLSRPLAPAVGRLTSAAIDDIVHFGTLNVGVVRGQPDGSLAPTVYAPIPVLEADARFLMLEAHAPTSASAAEQIFAGDEILELTGNELDNILNGEQLFTNLPMTASQLAPDEIPHGNLDERPTSPCEEIVLLATGDKMAHVYTPCTASGDWNKDLTVLPPVSLPGNVAIGEGAMLAHVNADDHWDLLIASTPYQEKPDKPDQVVDLYVAYGVGDGTFHSDPANLPASNGDGQAVLVKSAFPGLPLAAADLNGDGRDDFVFPGAIAYSQPCQGAMPCYNAGLHEGVWSHAVVADFNDNGYPDILASVQNSRVLVFLNGTPEKGVFNAARIPTHGVVKAIATGDFDGDLVADAALIETSSVGATGTAENDSLDVAFGSTQGPPEGPVSMGQVGPVEDLKVGQLWFVGPDEMTDIGVITTDATGERAVALFAGEADRQLQSPFRLTQDASQAPSLAVHAAIGRFDAQSPDDLAVLGFDFANPASAAVLPPQLWFLPVTGEAALSESTSQYTSLDSVAIDPCTANWVAMDLDGDGVDELVMLGRPRDHAKPGGQVAVARVKGGNFVFDPTIHIDDLAFQNSLWQRLVCRNVEHRGPGDIDTSDIGQVGSVQVADVDADKKPDLLVVALDGHWGDKNGAPSSKLVLFRNGGFDAAHRLNLTTSDDKLVMGAAALNVDGDAPLEIVIASNTGVYLEKPNLDSGALVPLQTVIEYPVWEQQALADPGTNGVTNLAVGDFNGDGLQDVVVGRMQRSEIYYGKPVRP